MRIYERYGSAKLRELGLTGKLPRHIGIIMDGNGRWAVKRLMPRPVGHRAGMDALHEIVRECHSLGIEAVTVYAFSTENWQRPAQEVNALFSLLTEYFEKEIDELDANDIRIITLGDLEAFPERVKNAMKNAVNRTLDNTGLKFCICINYGGRAELVRAVKSIMASGVSADEVDEKLISDNLYSAGIPDPDMIIRTAGEQRLSNFLLYQAAYSEFVFTQVLWPDFTPAELHKCIIEFMKRTRRFGKVVPSNE